MEARTRSRRASLGTRRFGKTVGDSSKQAGMQEVGRGSFVSTTK